MASVPVVYRDDYVTIHAGVVEASKGLHRVGDVLTLSVAVQFDPETSRVAELDSDFFESLFATQPAFRLLDSTEAPRIERLDSLAVIESQWRFQVLGCPGNSVSCPGTREYPLPMASIDYELSGEPGGRPSQRSARFRLWPGKLSLVSAFPEQLGDDASLDTWVQGGALPEPVVATASSMPFAPALVVIGGLLLIMGYIKHAGSHVGARSNQATPQTRWQKVGATLGDDGLSDAEWLDRYRRCLVWFLIDVKGVNPFKRLSCDKGVDGIDLLAEVSRQTSTADRAALLERLDSLTSPPHSGASPRD